MTGTFHFHTYNLTNRTTLAPRHTPIRMYIKILPTNNGLHLVALITQMDIEDKDIDYLIKIPNVSELLLPIVSIIPIDLIAYRVSIMLGNNPDKPRNLAKSVTVE